MFMMITRIFWAVLSRNWMNGNGMRKQLRGGRAMPALTLLIIDYYASCEDIVEEECVI
jgi:hypothetical protein